MIMCDANPLTFRSHFLIFIHTYDERNILRDFLKRFAFSFLCWAALASSTLAQIPTIASFAPPSGAVGSSVTVAGSNFDATTSNDIVYFGGVRAAVTTASTTQLTVTVPIGASYAPMSVTVGGLTGYSPSPFLVTFPGGAPISNSSFSAKTDFTTGTVPYGMAIGDLDGDGKSDIVVANNSVNTLSVFRNTGTPGSISSSTFAAAVTLTAATNPWGVALGDLDGDGKLDIVVSNGTTGTLSVFRNTSSAGSLNAGSFAAKVDFNTGGSGYGIAIGDIDGDGKPDIVATNRNASSVSLLRNTSAFGTITSGSFAANVDFTTGAASNPYGVVIVDFDGDGKRDIAVATSGAVSVFRNTSTSGSITAGSLAAKVDFVPSGTSIGVTAADIDGDGNPDLICANSADSTVSVFRNISTSGSITSGSFAAKVDFTLSGSPNSIAVGDIDSDGKPDLVIACGNGNTVSVLRNTSAVGPFSNSSFAARVDIAGAGVPYVTAVTDLDGDGKPDIAVTNNGASSFSAFRSIVGVPLAPLTISALPGNARVTLRWSKSIDPDFLRYRIYAGTSPGPSSKVDSTTGGVNDTTKTVTGLTNGARYYFRVTALDSAGNESAFSNELSTTPGPALRPASPAVNPAVWSKDSSFSISWTNALIGVVPVSKIWYATDTLPATATIVKSQSSTGTSASIQFTIVGKHTLYFYLEDSLGNKNADSVASVVLKFDNIAPTITENNATLDSVIAQANNSLSTVPAIVASATEPANQSGVVGMSLQYRRLDEQNWTTTAFGDVTFSSLTIPSSAFINGTTILGAEYRIQATDSAGNISSTNLLSFDIDYSSDLSVSNFADIPSVHSLGLAEGAEVKAYRLFSVPYELGNTKPSSFMEQSFGAHADKGVPYVNWKMVRLVNGAWSDYDAFKDLSVVSPGSAFFVLSKEHGTSATMTKPKIVRSDQMLYTGVKLTQGWNLVGDPFLVNIPFDKLIFEGGKHLAHYYYSGTGPQGGWEGPGLGADTLKSWQGLAIKVDSATTLRFNLTGVPFPVAPAAPRKNIQNLAGRSNEKEWTLRIDAFRDDIRISSFGTEIGMKGSSISNVDESDRFQAPFIGERNLLLSSFNSEGPLVRDVRGVNADGDTWDLLVRTGDGFANVELQFGPLNEITSQKFGARLLDLDKGLVYDIANQRTLRIVTGKEGVANFRLIVGTSSFIEKNLNGKAVIPEAAKLFDNYPNPFNPVTIVRYTVPNNAKSSRVSLNVYDILGREVRTLVNEDAVPGYYEVSFDGKDLSSGTYFCRLVIATDGKSYRETKKMLLMK